MTPFGNVVTQVLQKHDLSQRLLAQKLDWSPSYLSMLLGGHYARLKPELVFAIADAMEVDSDERSRLLDAAKISHRQYKIPYHVPESSYRIANTIIELIESEDEETLAKVSKVLFESTAN